MPAVPAPSRPDDIQRAFQIRLATFVVVLLILLERGWERLTTPDLWAEDGVVFLAQALTDGFASLGRSMAGSFFTFQRLVVLVSVRLLPLQWLPGVICGVCYVTFAGVMSRIVSRDYAWLIPSQTTRVVGACLFCLLPGLNEMAGNLCNLNWILFCWLAFVGLKDPSRPVTVFELAASALVTASIGTAILLVPLFAWRVARSVGRSNPEGLWKTHTIQLAMVLVIGVGLPVLFATDRLPGSAVRSYADVARLWYDHLARLTAFTPWVGDRLTYQLSEAIPAAEYQLGKIIFGVFLVVWAWSRRRDPRAQATILFLIGVSGWTVLALLTRFYAFDVLKRQHGDMFYANRYSFIMSFAAVVFWLVVLAPSSVRRLRPAMGAGLLLFATLNLTLPVYRFDINAYGRTRRWKATVSALDRSWRTGCPAAVTVQQYPEAWQFSYLAPPTGRECP